MGIFPHGKEILVIVKRWWLSITFFHRVTQEQVNISLLQDQMIQKSFMQWTVVDMYTTGMELNGIQLKGVANSHQEGIETQAHLGVEGHQQDRNLKFLWIRSLLERSWLRRRGQIDLFNHHQVSAYSQTPKDRIVLFVNEFHLGWES